MTNPLLKFPQDLDLEHDSHDLNAVRRYIKSSASKIDSSLRSNFEKLYTQWEQKCISAPSSCSSSLEFAKLIEFSTASIQSLVPLYINKLTYPEHARALIPYNKVQTNASLKSDKPLKVLEHWVHFELTGILPETTPTARVNPPNPPECATNPALKVSTYEYLQLSNDVYYAFLRPNSSTPSTLPKGWSVFAQSMPNSYDYFGRAYVKATGSAPHSVVIAHRGTDFTNPSNLFTDFQFLGSDVPPSFCYAIQFIQDVLKSSECASTDGGTTNGCCLSFSGHSLGAGLGELSALAYSENGGYRATVFESPGMRTLALNNKDSIGFCPDPYTFNITDASISKTDDLVTGYVSAPSLVNTMGEHFGQITRLSVPSIGYYINGTYVDKPNFAYSFVDYSYSTSIATIKFNIPGQAPVDEVQVASWYMVYSLGQHRTIIFNSTIVPQMYYNGEPRVVTTYPIWPSNAKTADCLRSLSANITYYTFGGFVDACVLNNQCDTTTTDLRVEIDVGNGRSAMSLNDTLGPYDTGVPLNYLGLGIGNYAIPYIKQMFGCSIGLSYYDSYVLNPFYWMSTLANQNPGWQSDSNGAVSFVKTVLLHDCSNGGVVVNGDDSGNVIWTTTHCIDTVTTGTGDDVHYIFCGNERIEDAGGSNTYHFVSDQLITPGSSICGNKVLSDHKGPARRINDQIIIDSTINVDSNGMPQSKYGIPVRGASVLITQNKCANQQPAIGLMGSAFGGNSPTGIPVFVQPQSGNEFIVLGDLFNPSKGSISAIPSMNWGDFGIQQPIVRPGSVIVGTGNNDITCDQNCIAAIGCPAPGQPATIQVAVNATAMVLGTQDPNIPVIFDVKTSGSNTVTIYGLKPGDTITTDAYYLNPACPKLQDKIPSFTLKFDSEESYATIVGNIATGGSLLCIYSTSSNGHDNGYCTIKIDIVGASPCAGAIHSHTMEQ